MPRATVSMESIQKDLVSCPGGFVKLRRMSYGERLHRQDISMHMAMNADSKSKRAQVDVRQTQTAVVAYELATAVVDHNLEDDNGRKLNFNDSNDVALLDGRIGEEISGYIDNMHDWEADLPNSDTKSTSSSTTSSNGTPKTLSPVGSEN